MPAGYLFTYYNSKVGKEREAQIDRVNEQVKDLYGPLLSCVTASKSAFDSMIQQHSPDGTRESFVSAIRASPDSREAQIYRWASLQPWQSGQMGYLRRASWCQQTLQHEDDKCTSLSMF